MLRTLHIWNHIEKTTCMRLVFSCTRVSFITIRLNRDIILERSDLLTSQWTQHWEPPHQGADRAPHLTETSICFISKVLPLQCTGTWTTLSGVCVWVYVCLWDSECVKVSGCLLTQRSRLSHNQTHSYHSAAPFRLLVELHGDVKPLFFLDLSVLWSHHVFRDHRCVSFSTNMQFLYYILI